MIRVITIDGACITEEEWEEFSTKAVNEWLGHDLACECNLETIEHGSYTQITAEEEVEGDTYHFICHHSEL